MVAKHDDERTDWFKWPVTIFLWVVILWIGYDVYSAMINRQELVADINSAVKVADSDPGAALARLETAQSAWARRGSSAGERFLLLIGREAPDWGEQAATLHANQAMRWDDRNEGRLVVRNYTLALVHDPELELNEMLPRNCYLAGNWELGLFAALAWQKQSPGQAAKMVEQFRKKVNPPWAR